MSTLPKTSERWSKNSFAGSAEGGLREVAYEFGRLIPHAGGDRASGGIGTRWFVSIVLFFVFAHCVQVSRDSIDTTPQHTTTTHTVQHKKHQHPIDLDTRNKVMQIFYMYYEFIILITIIL